MRAAAFAVACVVVSVGGHAFAGGEPVPGWAMGAGVLGALLMAYAVNRSERGAEVVLASTVAAQVVLHQLFAWSAPAPALPGHGHRLGMFVVHLVTAALTGWWLYRGERAVWLMLRLWAMGSLAAFRWLLTALRGQFPPPRAAVPVGVCDYFTGWEIASAVCRRGPPAVFHAG
ncbi:hypothetical protein [Acrocarpospora corrugata]|uniref:hypothetical protein n=1 Tax=Acrocarpospora corrugata TaxID=35763 RepID=UPI0012D34FB4|nr:hypothetical protein [Acrocarpospora corrugata]